MAKVCGYIAEVTLDEEYCKHYPFRHGDRVFIFGEVQGMSGHCVFADRKGKMHFGYHTDNFSPLDQDDETIDLSDKSDLDSELKNKL